MANPKDVNQEPASSPGQGVTEGSPSSTDVNARAAGTESSPEPKHEDAVPYSRFKEQIEKMRQLEQELAEERDMRQRLSEAKTEEFDWNVFGQPQQQAQQAQPQPQAQQQPYSPEEIG